MTRPKDVQTGDLFGVASVAACRFPARLTQTLIADADGFVTRDVPALAVTLEGVPGDRHAGFARGADSRVPWFPRGTPIRNSRQISIVAPDELASVAVRLGLAEVRPEWIGANLVIEGVRDLTQLPPGTRLHFASGATLAIEGENMPCRHAGAAVAERAPDAKGREGQGREGLDLAFVQAAKGLRGLVAWVERAGEMVAGEPMDVRVPAQRLWRRGG